MSKAGILRKQCLESMQVSQNCQQLTFKCVPSHAGVKGIEKSRSADRRSCHGGRARNESSKETSLTKDFTGNCESMSLSRLEGDRGETWDGKK